MKLALAPMEGLVDVHMRTLLTRNRAFDYCVTEFLRITNQLLPERVFTRLCPEALDNWQTPSGTPVHLQLLGGEPQPMAENACRGVELGAPVIDVNFGCPSKFVCNSVGGSILLKDPNNLYRVLYAMRQAMPDHIPLTAKMRLGFEDKSLAIENAQAVEAAGASMLCIHARTKVEGYKPPAHWEWIAKVKEQVTIPIMANGEIWTIKDFDTCRQVSGCDDIMLGRGAVATPDLALQIKQRQLGEEYEADTWKEQLTDLQWMLDTTVQSGNIKFAADRMKQWLAFFKMQHTGAVDFFESIKRIKDHEQLGALIRSEIEKQG
ncbi:MAG: tRNA-dihydrouridine synthase C [Bermanella sp.]|jgi:tRNA-dihydrouridine synthase C